jgi:hypothetical protein
MNLFRAIFGPSEWEQKYYLLVADYAALACRHQGLVDENKKVAKKMIKHKAKTEPKAKTKSKK